MKNRLLCSCLFVVFVFCSLFPIRSTALHNSGFDSWIEDQSKSYATQEEYLTRSKIFTDNLQWILSHNKKELSYRVSINQFADLTTKEFYEQYLQGNQESKNFNVLRLDLRAPLISFNDIPEQWDWRDYGVVTEPKTQGQCQSCWAFAATGVVESFHAINEGELVSLSEQNLMDCSWKQGNHGCGGGNPDAALKYIIHNNGIDTEESYPYEMSTTTNCRYDKTNRGATIGNFTTILRGNETELKQVVAFMCPVASLIDGNDPGFQFYESGIYYNPFCSTWRMNHAVLVVGYGVDNSSSTVPDYWIAKNSYGPGWGNNGYINMARNQNNSCGIATHASYPLY